MHIVLARQAGVSGRMFVVSKAKDIPSVSIIIPCRNEQHYVRQTVDHIHAVDAGRPYEIIVVDDGSTDGCCDFLRYDRPVYLDVRLLNTLKPGVARARNLGAGKADGRFLVFCDAHLVVSPGWLKGLTGRLEEGKAEAVCPAIAHTAAPGKFFYGGTWNGKLCWISLTVPPAEEGVVPLAPSGCLAVRRDVFFAAGGFEEEFKVWGYDDAEFSLKLWLFGHRVTVDPRIRILHISRPLPEHQQNGEYLVHNLLLLAILHFSGPRLARTIELARGYPDFTPGLPGILWRKHYARRQDYFQRRVFSDDWFMRKFNIPF